MKSIEVRFNEALEALKKAGKRQKFDAKLEKLKDSGKVTIGVQLNLAETILKESHLIRSDGGELFTKSFSDGYVSEVTDPRELQVKSYMLTCRISEAEARKVLGLPPAGLTRKQVAEYALSRAVGINEADALRLCKK